jgi:hypothetical protein
MSNEQVETIGHELVAGPRETVPGWVVECRCGWNNHQRAAESAEKALDQYAVHVR